MKSKNPIHSANKKRWEAAADNWAAAAESRGKWKKAHNDPSIALCEKTLSHLTDMSDKSVVVLGSGDNEAAFAFAGMGAKVTSIDISKNQLKHAEERAKQLGLEMNFVVQDVCDLNLLEDNSFDLVYTGGHVAIWVADLDKYYKEATRILKPGGKFIVEEYHPFRRVWKDSKTKLEVGYNYFNRGPFKFQYSDDVLRPEKGDFETFEFHWTVSDYCNAMIKAGCQILEIYEYGDEYVDWEVAPVDGLPNILSLIGMKGTSSSPSN